MDQNSTFRDALFDKLNGNGEMPDQAGWWRIWDVDSLVLEFAFKCWLNTIGYAQDVGDSSILQSLKIVGSRYIA